MNVFYVSIRTTENYNFDKIRTAGVTGNATNYKNSQGDNPICSEMKFRSPPGHFHHESPLPLNTNRRRVDLVPEIAAVLLLHKAS